MGKKTIFCNSNANNAIKKIEGKTPASVEPRGYNAPALTHDQKYALPDHQYTFLSFPLLGGDRGGKISQRIRYEEMLPTCAGKLHKLEWSHLTEEDRYTKRNFLIREGIHCCRLTSSKN